MTLSMGPYKFDYNFIEASSENIIFGGSEATKTPADIEIRYNHFYKPLTWLKGQKGYVGGSNGNPFVVKNLLESKNAQRVLFEGNILEYTWGGFSQSGYAILLTPKNQSSGGLNVCPLCEVTDITIRYSTISHVGSGLEVANGLSDSGGAPLAGERYSIHDITLDDINPTLYVGTGILAQVSMGIGIPTPGSKWISITLPGSHRANSLMSGDFTASSPKISNFTFNNSIVNAGAIGTRSTGGGSTNCAFSDKPITNVYRLLQSLLLHQQRVDCRAEQFAFVFRGRWEISSPRIQGRWASRTTTTASAETISSSPPVRTRMRAPMVRIWEPTSSRLIR